MENNNIEQIIAKFLEGTISSGESTLFFQWLKEKKENRKVYFSYKKVWLEAKTGEDDGFVDQSWQRLQLRTVLQDDRSQIRNYGWRDYLKRFSVAASILFLLGISLYVGIEARRLTSFDQTVHEIHVPLGSRTSLTLPDGSCVWLNAGSTLTYNAGFGRRNREVKLVGEAYFDVQEGKSLPFLVQTRDMKILVRGTKFNVKSYPEEKLTETTLLSGQIDVLLRTRDVSAHPIKLFPNQKLSFSRDCQKVTIANEQEEEQAVVLASDETKQVLAARPNIALTNVRNTDEYVSWKDGRLIFRSEPLKSLVPKLERFYNVKIVFKDDSIQNNVYTGTLEDVTVEEVLRAIAASSGVSFEIDKNHITLSK